MRASTSTTSQSIRDQCVRDQVYLPIADIQVAVRSGLGLRCCELGVQWPAIARALQSVRRIE